MIIGRTICAITLVMSALACNEIGHVESQMRSKLNGFSDPAEDPSLPAEDVSLKGKLLTNVIEGANGLLQQDALTSQSCTRTESSILLRFAGYGGHVGAFSCSVSFRGSELEHGKRICLLAESGSIDSVRCAPKGGLNPVSYDFEYDGTNFRFSRVSQGQVPESCPDLSGEYIGVRDIRGAIFGVDNPANNTLIKMRLDQTGCRTIKIAHVFDPKKADAESDKVFDGTYTADGTSKTTVDAFDPWCSNEFVSYFEDDSLVIRNTGCGVKFRLKAFKDHGWKKIEVTGLDWRGYSTYNQLNYVQVQRPQSGGPCEGLLVDEIPPGFTCRSTSGFLWERVSEGWKDLSTGRSWIGPFFGIPKEGMFGPYQDHFTNPYMAASYCEELGLKLPSSGIADYFGRNSESMLANSDFGVANAHGLREVFGGFKAWMPTSEWDRTNTLFWSELPPNEYLWEFLFFLGNRYTTPLTYNDGTRGEFDFVQLRLELPRSARIDFPTPIWPEDFQGRIGFDAFPGVLCLSK